MLVQAEAFAHEPADAVAGHGIARGLHGYRKSDTGMRQPIGLDAQGEEAVIEIEDRGCGIPEEIRHRVFEPFFSFGKSEGIGLGMAMARKIVEEHEGEIEIESAFGRGTLVRFVIPVAGPREPAEVA